jgi:transposase-like protein
LTTWFYAIYLMSATRCGISAKQIERETGVTYKTAWRMFKQIRSMLQDGTTGIGGPDGGSVEMDESVFGGRRRGQQGRPTGGKGGKTIVVGMVERKGPVVAVVANDTTRQTLHGLAKEYILPASTVYTDDFNAYHGLAGINGYRHRRINHSAGIYVMGPIHTQSVEGFWSLVKRGIGGVYHSVSRKYLQTYLDEYTFRYNRRFDLQPMFTSFLGQISKNQLPAKSSAETAEESPVPF